MKIYKYNLLHRNLYENIRMPEGAKILSFQYQLPNLVIWCLADNKKPEEVRKFITLATGMEFTDQDLKYIGTAQEEQLVWHLFEVKQDDEVIKND